MNNVILLAIGSAFLVLSACEKEGEPKPLSEKKVKAPAVIEVEDTQGNNNESSEQTITNNQVKNYKSWLGLYFRGIINCLTVTLNIIFLCNYYSKVLSI